MNDSFNYKTVRSWPYEENHLEWEVNYDGHVFTGKAFTVRQALRRAKRAVRRHRKMTKFLKKGK